MATMLPRTLLALCLLLSACKRETMPPVTDERLPTEKETPSLSGERLEKYKSLCEEGYHQRAKFNYIDALATYQKALALCDKTANAKEWSDSASGLVWAYENAQETEKADALYREIFAQNDEQFGKNPPQSAPDLDHLAQLILIRGHDEQSESLMRRAIALCEIIRGRNLPSVGIYGMDSDLLSDSLWHLGAFLEKSGRLEEAEPILRRSLKATVEMGKKIEHSQANYDLRFKLYRNVLLKMGDTEEQAQEKIDKMMKPLTKK